MPAGPAPLERRVQRKYDRLVKRSMNSVRARTGVSRVAVAVVAAAAAIVIAGGGYALLARSPATSTTTASLAGVPPPPVQTAVDRLIQDLNERNVDGMVAFYSSNAVDVWFGNTGGLSGRYVGPEQIRLIYAASVGKTTSLDANLSDYAQDAFSPTNVNTTFVISMLGNSTVAGILTAKVDVSEEWNWGSPGWQISKENWNYAIFDASNIDANLSTSTTFPQWAVMRMGGNPNLVSEKNFEWHAGPYLAAAVYAFLFGILALAVTSYTTRRFPDKAPARGFTQRIPESACLTEALQGPTMPNKG
jgi:hypothetical protein